MNAIKIFAVTRVRRLLFSVLVPPFAGAMVLVLMDVVRTGTVDIELLVVFVVVMAAYTIMGLQSLVAALMMEFIILRYAKAQYQVVLSGAMLGLLAGATLFSWAPEFMLIGLGVGLLIGLVYRHTIA